MLIEGLAMGAFATLHAKTRDPLLRRTVQLVMTDEAFHHRFGRIWAKRTVPHLSEREHEAVEDWAARCFHSVFTNLINAEQKQAIYQRFGLDWRWVQAAMAEAFGDRDRRRNLQEGTNMFRVLIKTLLHGGIITDRTRHVYQAWVDVQELQAEPQSLPGESVADESLAELREINRSRRKQPRRTRRAHSR
jgi:hypothetical protein